MHLQISFISRLFIPSRGIMPVTFPKRGVFSMGAQVKKMSLRVAGPCLYKQRSTTLLQQIPGPKTGDFSYSGKV